MSQSNPVLKTFITATDMSSTNYRFVKMSASQTVADSGAGEAIVGIRQDSPDGTDSDTNVNVAIMGTAKLTLGGDVTYGQFVKAGTAGAGVVADTNLDVYGAMALESGASGEVIEVLVINGQMSIA